MSGAPGSFGRTSLHVGAGSRVECFTYKDKTPILDISAGSASVAICIAGNGTDDAALTFARALVRQAERFAAEVERLHAEQAESGDSKAADSAAA